MTNDIPSLYVWLRDRIGEPEGKPTYAMGGAGFTRLDEWPCGCARVYRGSITGAERGPDVLRVGVGHEETFRPCAQHRKLRPPRGVRIERRGG